MTRYERNTRVLREWLGLVLFAGLILMTLLLVVTPSDGQTRQHRQITNKYQLMAQAEDKSEARAPLIVPSTKATILAPSVMKVSEEERWKLVSLFQNRVLRSMDVQKAQEAERKAAEEQSVFIKGLLVKYKWPDDTSFSVTNDSHEVTVTIPQAKVDGKGDESSTNKKENN